MYVWFIALAANIDMDRPEGRQPATHVDGVLMATDDEDDNTASGDQNPKKNSRLYKNLDPRPAPAVPSVGVSFFARPSTVSNFKSITIKTVMMTLCRKSNYAQTKVGNLIDEWLNTRGDIHDHIMDTYALLMQKGTGCIEVGSMCTGWAVDEMVDCAINDYMAARHGSDIPHLSCKFMCENETWKVNYLKQAFPECARIFTEMMELGRGIAQDAVSGNVQIVPKASIGDTCLFDAR
jgi:hypothetical protein